MKKWSRIRFCPNLPLGENGRRVTGCKEHIELSKNAAKEGMILLKNKENVLPLKRGTKVALFGKGTFDYVKGGGGSGDVTVAYTRNLYEGLKLNKDKVVVFEELCEYYRQDVQKQYAVGKVPGMTVEPDIPVELLVKAKQFTDTAIISICRYSGEAWDRKSIIDPNNTALCEDERRMTELSASLFQDGDFCLSEKEREMVETVKENFQKVIVVLNIGGMFDTSWFVEDDQIQAALLALQGGMEGGLAAAELLLGDGNPSGKLCDTFAKTLEDYPSTYNFHESRDYVDYTDDIYVGYRYFETIPGAAEKVNCPFGYGLSYTTFAIDVIDAVCENGKFTMKASVTNTGNYKGKEVVQLYISKPQGKLGNPAKELTAFVKTRELQVGETQLIELHCELSALAAYDDLGKVQKSAYVLEKGDYRFYVGTSVRDVEEVDLKYQLEKDVIVKQLSAKLVPTSLSRRMLSDGSYEELPMTDPVDPNASVIGVLDNKYNEGKAPMVRAIPGYQFVDGMQRHGEHGFMEVVDGKISMDDFVAQFSIDELIHLLGGQPNVGIANAFGFGNMPEYGIPNIMTADGPAGLRIEKKCGVVTTAWPCATLLACTWNPDVVYQVGAAGAAEVKENNIAVWLTPAVNIHRSPLCGRNFEYYSEDPYVAGTIAAAMTEGVQSNYGCGTTIKHFACNNQEDNRMGSDSVVSERTLRELYLKGFEIAVKESQPMSIMTSYNLINGVHAANNYDLCTDAARNEWGFKGMIMTDWTTTEIDEKCTASGCMRAGNDLVMPGCFGDHDNMRKALAEGTLKIEDLKACIARLVSVIWKSNQYLQ